MTIRIIDKVTLIPYKVIENVSEICSSFTEEQSGGYGFGNVIIETVLYAEKQKDKNTVANKVKFFRYLPQTQKLVVIRYRNLGE